MKLTRWILGMLMVGLMAVAACKKGPAEPTLDPVDVNGVKVDLPKLQAYFTETNADLQNSARKVVMAFRYGQYESALMELDKLSNDPALDETQKKLVSDMIEQVKQVMSKAQPAQ